MKRTGKKYLSKDIVQVFYSKNNDLIIQNISSDSINFSDKEGRTPVFYAVITKNLAILSWLVENGANINIKDNIGWTPLHYVAQDYLPEFAEFLLKKGIEVDAIDKHGNSALWRATYASSGRGEIIKTLLHYNANPNKENKYGISPIDLAKTIANFNVLQFFL